MIKKIEKLVIRLANSWVCSGIFLLLSVGCALLAFSGFFEEDTCLMVFLSGVAVGMWLLLLSDNVELAIKRRKTNNPK